MAGPGWKLPTLKAATAFALAASAALAAPALAQAPQLDGIVSDHAVLQRGRAITVTGTAEPGETVTVNLAGESASAAAGRDGRFRVTLGPLLAGGPFEMQVTAKSGLTLVRDLLVGDVFLCSGQSNMELPVERAQDSWSALGGADAQLRLLTVPRGLAATPQAHFARAPEWAAASPANIPGFSAACFYMAQTLRQTEKVPIGAIHASWGGSRISAWMGAAALHATGADRAVALLKLHQTDANAAMRATNTIWEDWWRGEFGGTPGTEPWQPGGGGALHWQPVPRISFFSKWQEPALTDYLGMLWYRRHVTLTAAQARQGAVLTLGIVDDADRTWINGKPVGGSSIGGPRSYAVPAGTLQPGDNLIVVNDDNVYADGGMAGPADIMRLQFVDGTSVPLGDGWDYAIGGRPKTAAPRVPWDDLNGSSVMYNAMIAPLGALQLTGVAWYQGESDTDIPGYGLRLAAMMREWREQFASPTLPFAIVELSAYGAPATAPVESNWARLRDAQRRTAEADGNAAVVVTIDHGDPLDIHPGEKQEVGRRIARVMRALAYRKPLAASGPRIAGVKRNSDGGVALRFADVAGALETHSAAQAIGFELCGPAAGSCRYVAGQVSGDEVTLAGDGKPVAKIRFGWADAPLVNLFDQAPLPAGPFEIAVP